MESLLAPLLVLVTVTAALIPLLLLSMLGAAGAAGPERTGRQPACGDGAHLAGLGRRAGHRRLRGQGVNGTE